ncbi:MAG: hypothetical protein KF726_04510 [Anaerolineae bacterium]|nr:hypothetical protein [Anaerolineae bacterium]
MRNRAVLYLCSIAIILTLIIPLASDSVIRAQDNPITWQVWERKDINRLDGDNSGSTFAISEDVQTPEGQNALQITPGGSSDETKLAFPVSGADLPEWTQHDHLNLQVYLPETNELNPNRFFLGMADVTGSFSWIAGVFSDSDMATLQAGWNNISFPLDPAMKKTKPDAKYNLYLSFFHEGTSGKTVLTEPFYLGSMTLTTTPPTQDKFAQEAEHLLTLADAALLDAVARKTFDFFWYESNPANGLIKDRSTLDSASSVASVGFGLSAIPIAIERGWISYEEGYARTLITLKTFASGGVKGKFGFFFHFVNMQTGDQMWDSEVSSIDTALFLAGAITAGEYFKDTEVAALSDQIYRQVDWATFAPNGKFISMGWKPEVGFYDAEWDHFDENPIMYMLALGSPTHPLPAESWTEMKRPVYVPGKYIYLPGEPLFVYQYPLAWLDLRDKEDAFANYVNNTKLACQRNQQFSAENAKLYSTYQDGVWGLSASDGPQGYRAYGAAPNNHDGTIAPYASIACLPFTPDAALESMRAMLKRFGSKVWREYGFVSAINADQDWYSREFIGIDQGDILLMIANYQDGFVWKLFMQNEHIQKALKTAGFVTKQSDYAVVPAFLEKVQGSK